MQQLLMRKGMSRQQVEALIAGGDSEIDAHITALADARVSAQAAQPNRIESMPVFVATGAFTPVANQVYLSKFRVGKAITIHTLVIYVAAAAGNVDLGIYSSDGTTLTKVGSTGSTAVVGSGATQSIALQADTSLTPGVDYYLAAEFSTGTTISVHRSQINNLIGEIDKRAVSVAGGAFPLPATIPLASTSGTSSPVMIVGLP